MAIKLLDLEPTRRNAILNAALKEFSIKGFDKSSTNIISKESCISKALMFHYVNSKQELFLCVYDFFSEILEKEYYEKMDFTEKDILNRLFQSYLLQIELLKKYPYILAFDKLSRMTNCDELNKEIEKRNAKNKLLCNNNIFEKIDESKFRQGLDIEVCKQFILWSNIGFTNEILDEIRKLHISKLNYENIIKKLEKYFEELRKIFYK